MHKALTKLLQQPVVLETHEGFVVAREDLLPGGAKMRFLPYIIDPKAKELVFAGPFCGGAPVCLSEIGKRTGQKVTLFYAARNVLHPRQQLAKANGAKIIAVSPGYMAVNQARAREYAKKKGAQMFPLGLDVPEASAPFVEFLRALLKGRRKKPPQIWCATGSGMLARCLGEAFPNIPVFGVCVGLASRHGRQKMSPNVKLLECSYDFSKACEFPAPFPSCPYYERKAWETMHQERAPKGSLFFNVYG